MKALTVKQPWAQLICAGIKDIENRTWKTNFRGRVLVHASAVKANIEHKPFSLGYYFAWKYKIKSIQIDEMIKRMETTSAIIGSVEIVDCVINHPSIWAEKCIRCNDNKWRCKHCKNVIYNWVLANPVLFNKPIENVKGKLSFWEYPSDILIARMING